MQAEIEAGVGHADRNRHLISNQLRRWRSYGRPADGALEIGSALQRIAGGAGWPRDHDSLAGSRDGKGKAFDYGLNGGGVVDLERIGGSRTDRGIIGDSARHGGLNDDRGGGDARAADVAQIGEGNHIPV